MSATRRAILRAGVALAAGAAAGAAAPDRTAVTITLGSYLITYLPVLLAAQLGYYRDQGLDVTVQNIQGGGGKAMQALLGGSTNIVAGYFDHTVEVRAQNQDVVSVVLLSRDPGMVLAVRSDLAGTIKSVQDLRGRRVGVVGLGASGDFFIRYYAKRNGIDPASLHLVGVGSGNTAVAAIENRLIDAIVTFDPAFTLMESRGLAKALVDARTPAGTETAFGGPYAGATLYSTGDYIVRHADTVQRVVTATVRALGFMAASTPAQIVAGLPPEDVLGDRAVFTTMIRESLGMFSHDGVFDPAALQTPLAVLRAVVPSVADASIDLSKTYTNRFVH
ncbi:MAG: ABC transporter substrate-binding protein [Acetobacteraceae bacterium]